MTVQVLSVATRAVIEACEQLGLDGDAILADAKLERAQVFDPDARLPAEQADSVWAAAWARADDPDLALHAAEKLPDGAYRVLDFVVANSPTVSAALSRIARYFPIVDPRGRFEIRENSDEVRLEFLAGGVSRVPPSAQLYSFAAIVTRLRRSSGIEVPVKRVEFDFPQPEDVKECRRIFASALTFGAALPALVFSHSAVQLELPRANADLLSVLDNHAERLVRELPSPEANSAVHARAALHDELRGGNPSAEHLAKRLGMSERTLQRRLAEAGTSYVQLLSEVRREVAEEYLKGSGASLSEIAWLLGFSDQSAFSRAFKRWTGASPAAYRKRSRAA